MVLESQTARDRSGRSFTSTKKRSTAMGMWLILGIVVVSVGAWLAMGGFSSWSRPADAELDATAQLPPPQPRQDEPDTAAAIVAATEHTDALANVDPPAPEPEPTPEPVVVTPPAPAPMSDPEPEAEPEPEPEVAPASEPEPEAEVEPAPQPQSDPVVAMEDPEPDESDAETDAESEPTPEAESLEGSSVEAILARVQETADRVEARGLLNQLLVERSDELAPSDEKLVRQALTNLNLQLVYSATVVKGDPLTYRYRVQRGDVLVRIAQRNKVTWQLLAWINDLASADNIRIDQNLKVVRGPFHAVVHKSAFRMDLFLTDPDTGKRIFINSVPVGIGRDDGTPEGKWIVSQGGKVINPEWADPRTGRVWAADDPKNPIGEFWIGLEGTDANTATMRGYGIHGTTDPDSIGDDRSMGCVRLGDKDIALVYKLLYEGESTVVILP